MMSVFEAFADIKADATGTCKEVRSWIVNSSLV
jgi:hypothetical protein